MISMFASVAGAEPASSAANAGDLEKVWNCDPGIVNRRYYELMSPACSSGRMSQPEIHRLLRILVDTYGDPHTKAAEDALSVEWDRRSRKSKREAQRIADAPKLARQRALKEGRARPSSYEDALLFHSPRDLAEIMKRPLLTPDSEIYAGAVLIEGQQDQNVLRVRITDLGSELRYAFLVTGSKTKNYAPAQMRVNSFIHVTGRYIRNSKYRTVIGAERTGPVLDAMYIGDETLNFPK